MAFTELFQDSASVSTTEYFLAADSTTPSYQSSDGAVQLWLELNNLAAGDEFRLRVYEKISSGGTARVAGEWSLLGPVGSPIYVVPTLIFLHGWDFSLTRIAGSDRSIAWSIRAIT